MRAPGEFSDFLFQEFHVHMLPERGLLGHSQKHPLRCHVSGVKAVCIFANLIGRVIGTEKVETKRRSLKPRLWSTKYPITTTGRKAKMKVKELKSIGL